MCRRNDGLWISLFQLRNFNWLLRNGTKGSPIRNPWNPQAVTEYQALPLWKFKSYKCKSCLQPVRHAIRGFSVWAPGNSCLVGDGLLGRHRIAEEGSSLGSTSDFQGTSVFISMQCNPHSTQKADFPQSPPSLINSAILLCCFQGCSLSFSISRQGENLVHRPQMLCKLDLL